MSNAAHLRGSAWLNFQRVLCRRWHHGNRVLIGDAAHTAHFSIGSGTKLAMEDADRAGRRAPRERPTSPRRSPPTRRSGRPRRCKLQSAARNRMRWFEDVARYTQARALAVHLQPADRQPAHRPRQPQAARPGLRGGRRGAARGARGRRRSRARRCSCRSSCVACGSRTASSSRRWRSTRRRTACPDDWHLVHLGARATGGAGLVFTEMTCVSPEGRISPGCTGIWNAAQRDAWRRIVDFVHAHSRTKLCMQLGHSGRKGSTQLGWQDEDRPLPSGNWETLAPSPLPYLEGISAPPREMTRADMDRVLGEFVQARALRASTPASTCSSCTWPTATCSRASSRR